MKGYIPLIFVIFILLLPMNIYAENMNVLNVAVDPTLPPFQFKDNGEIIGLNIDILNYIGEKNNIYINYIPMNKSISVDKLLDGEVDLILGIRYDPKLKEKIEYTQNIVQSVISILAKSNNYEDIQSNLNDNYFLASVENNSTEQNFLQHIRKINFNVAFNQEDAFQLLLMDRADFFIGVKETAEFLLNNHNMSKEYTIIDSYMAPVEYFIAVQIGNKDLYNVIDNGLRNIKLSGEYEKLYNKWVINREALIKRRLQNIVRLVVAISIIFVLTILWNIQLSKLVKEKTIELSKANMDLKSQIIETQNNIELKNLICESSPRGIVTFDLNGNITMFNNSALKMASLKRPPIKESIYHIEPMNLMVDNVIDEVFAHRIGYTCEEFRYKKDDQDYIYRYVMYPLEDFENKLRGGIITIEDITESVKLREQILERDKNRALTQIVAGISHEIRNPLTTIKTFIELIPTKIDNPDFRREIALVVPEEIKRMDNLISNLIDYSMPRSLNKSNFFLSDIVDYCISLLEPMLEKENILLCNAAKTEYSIYCDENQVKQSIINFLLNSIDAIREKKEILKDADYQGNIELKSYTHGNDIMLKIMDNGIGIENVELEKIHSMFYTTKEKGVGLGMPLSVQMLNMNNCKVSIESQHYQYTSIFLKFSR